MFLIYDGDLFYEYLIVCYMLFTIIYCIIILALIHFDVIKFNKFINYLQNIVEKSKQQFQF